MRRVQIDRNTKHRGMDTKTKQNTKTTVVTSAVVRVGGSPESVSLEMNIPPIVHIKILGVNPRKK